LLTFQAYHQARFTKLFQENANQISKHSERSSEQLDDSKEPQKKGDLIAVVAARPVLDKITERFMMIEGKEIVIREYPATSIEEALIAAIHAERDGALALVCAPIVSPTVERILRIPVASIMPQNSLVEAIRLAARKIG